MEEPAPPYLTYPFTEEDAAQAVEWALQFRPGKNKYVESRSAEKLKTDFLKDYLRFPIPSDRQDFWDSQKERHKKFRRGDITQFIIQPSRLKKHHGIDAERYSMMADFLLSGSQPPLALWIWEESQINKQDAGYHDFNVWIDTYLLAQSRFDYSLFLETFNPADHQPGPIPTDAPPVAIKNASDKVEDLEPPPPITIGIPNTAKPGLIAALTKLLKDPEQHQSLKDLINKQTKPAEPIVFDCPAKRVTEPFVELKKSGQLRDIKVDITDWFREHLRYTGKRGESKSLKKAHYLI